MKAKIIHIQAIIRKKCKQKYNPVRKVSFIAHPFQYQVVANRLATDEQIISTVRIDYDERFPDEPDVTFRIERIKEEVLEINRRKAERALAEKKKSIEEKILRADQEIIYPVCRELFSNLKQALTHADYYHPSMRYLSLSLQREAYSNYLYSGKIDSSETEIVQNRLYELKKVIKVLGVSAGSYSNNARFGTRIIYTGIVDSNRSKH